MNDLTGALLQFRKDAVGIMVDIEQLFYRFLVTEEHRDFLRFYCYRNNDSNEELIEYRMKVHVLETHHPQRLQCTEYRKQWRTQIMM